MSARPQFTLAFNLQATNEQRREMFALYEKAFGAKKLSEGTPPGGSDIHIMMELCGTEILLGPGGASGKGMQNPIICEVRFTEAQEFYQAYDLLKQEGREASLEGPYPWAHWLALITDKFGVGWALYLNP